MQRMAETAQDEGRRPFVIPLGAGTPRGALGYVGCLQEILVQAGAQDVRCADSNNGFVVLDIVW